MPALSKIARQKNESIEKERLKRVLKSTGRADGVFVMRGKKRLISFCCNDYLGLTHHPEVVKAAKQALDEYGAGAGASRLVSGNVPLYTVLEKKLAKIKGTEAACVFGSGYLANIGVIPALVGRGDLILADRLVHASMVDGIQLSGAKLVRFHHNDVQHAATLLGIHRGSYRHCLMLSEHVFSMDGDVAPLKELQALAKKYDAWLMSDDAHGLGILKPSVKTDIQMGTLSKAVGGYGGYVCASQEIIDYLISSARSLTYSTGLPPSVVASAIAALDVIVGDKALAKKPLENARLFTEALGLPEAQSPIVPLVIGEEEKALEAARILENEGYLVVAIRPPTVPVGTARLRFAFSALHKKKDILKLAGIVQQHGWAWR